jgi:hypothetical protein
MTAGVAVASGSGNSIRQNSIFSNTGLGIDLGADGVTANDSLDADAGANGLQNYPELYTSTYNATTNEQTTTWWFNSTPNSTFTIDFYSNSNAVSDRAKITATFS